MRVTNGLGKQCSKYGQHEIRRLVEVWVADVGVKQHGRQPPRPPRVSSRRTVGRLRAVHPLAAVHHPRRDPRQTDARGHQQTLPAPNFI